MRIIKLTLSLLFAACALSSHLAAADGATVQAILINASNEKTAADPRLAAYEAELQRMVPESSFRFIAQGTAAVTGSGHATISLGSGHRIELDRDKGGGLRLKIQWMNGTKLVLGGTFNAQPGVPIMLGNRPSGEGAVPIVLVIAK